jgi:hypothetical protein
MLYGVKLLLPVFLTSEVYLKQRIQKTKCIVLTEFTYIKDLNIHNFYESLNLQCIKLSRTQNLIIKSKFEHIASSLFSSYPSPYIKSLYLGYFSLSFFPMGIFCKKAKF